MGTYFTADGKSQKKVKTEEGENPQETLHQAVKDGDLDQVKNLLAQGVNPKYTDHLVHSPISTACLHGNVDIIEALTKHHPYLLTDEKHAAMCFGFLIYQQQMGNDVLKAIKMLLEYKPTIIGNFIEYHKKFESAREHFYIALFSTIQINHFEAVMTLLRNDRTLAHKGNNGSETALMCAVKTGSLMMVQLITMFDLESLEWVDTNGYSAAQYARGLQQFSMENLIEERIRMKNSAAASHAKVSFSQPSRENALVKKLASLGLFDGYAQRVSVEDLGLMFGKMALELPVETDTVTLTRELNKLKLMGVECEAWTNRSVGPQIAINCTEDQLAMKLELLSVNNDRKISQSFSI